MGFYTDLSKKNQAMSVLLVVGLIGGGFQGLQQGVNCALTDVSVDKPGDGVVTLENTGSVGLTLEVKKTSYDSGTFSFVSADEERVSIGTGESRDIELKDNQIMKYIYVGCRAKSELVRYGEIDPYTGGPDVSETLERYD